MAKGNMYIERTWTVGWYELKKCRLDQDTPPILESGQNRKTTLPMTESWRTGPKYLPSWELSRLSPSGKTYPWGTYMPRS